MGEAFTLPTGLEVRLKRLQLLDLAALGQIPSTLIGLANKQLAEDAWTISVQNFQKYEPVVRLLAHACIQEPANVPAELLSAADCIAIWNWANEVTVAVRPFRPERNGDEAAGPGGVKVRAKAKRDPGNPG